MPHEATPSGTVIQPTGNIIAARSKELREQIQSVIDQGAVNIIIDMQKVELVDSTGIGVIVGTQNTLKPRSGKLTVINLSTDILKMFKIMKLDNWIDIASS